MKNPKYINDLGGISLEKIDGSGFVYAEPKSQLHTKAKSGMYGPVAPYSPKPDIPTAPSEDVPQSVSRRQGRLALLQADKLDAVEAAIANDRQGQIEYEADTWERSNPFLQALWAQLGGTESELDELFIMAATL